MGYTNLRQIRLFLELYTVGNLISSLGAVLNPSIVGSVWSSSCLGIRKRGPGPVCPWSSFELAWKFRRVDRQNSNFVTPLKWFDLAQCSHHQRSSQLYRDKTGLVESRHNRKSGLIFITNMVKRHCELTEERLVPETLCEFFRQFVSCRKLRARTDLPSQGTRSSFYSATAPDSSPQIASAPVAAFPPHSCIACLNLNK